MIWLHSIQAAFLSFLALSRSRLAYISAVNGLHKIVSTDPITYPVAPTETAWQGGGDSLLKLQCDKVHEGNQYRQ